MALVKSGKHDSTNVKLALSRHISSKVAWADRMPCPTPTMQVATHMPATLGPGQLRTCTLNHFKYLNAAGQ
jgi:hypothetical protein